MHTPLKHPPAPYTSDPGPGVLPFFAGCDPFKRWVLPKEKAAESSTEEDEASSAMQEPVETLVRSTIQSIKEKGGTVAGLIGFSQGTRIVAGLLKGAEIAARLRAEGNEAGELAWLDFAFALSVCGSFPPPLLPAAASAALAASSLPADAQEALLSAKIAIPTYHVQGVSDEWAWAGKLLIENTFDVGDGKSVVMEAEMGHHYPSVPEETAKLRDWIVDVYEQSVGEAEER